MTDYDRLMRRVEKDIQEMEVFVASGEDDPERAEAMDERVTLYSFMLKSMVFNPHLAEDHAFHEKLNARALTVGKALMYRSLSKHYPHKEETK